MTQFQSILCPVDLSDTNVPTIELATKLAKQSHAKLVFIYVAPQWLPEEAMFGSEYIRETVAEDKESFHKLRPTDSEVKFDHLFVNGNPGPEIVRESKKHDLVVISTHGRSGVMRLLMGSVAQYVLRHADCPVISYRTSGKSHSQPAETKQSEPKHFVTELMHHVAPVQGFEKMEGVIAELQKTNETGTPVINEMGTCVGILTKSDIDKYRDICVRFENRDASVVDEVFETDEFGQRRAGSVNFDQVHRNMTSPVITISNTQSCKQAQELFDANQEIHHLVVIDELGCPIGILESDDLINCESLSTEA